MASPTTSAISWRPNQSTDPVVRAISWLRCADAEYPGGSGSPRASARFRAFRSSSSTHSSPEKQHQEAAYTVFGGQGQYGIHSARVPNGRKGSALSTGARNRSAFLLMEVLLSREPGRRGAVYLFPRMTGVVDSLGQGMQPRTWRSEPTPRRSL